MGTVSPPVRKCKFARWGRSLRVEILRSLTSAATLDPFVRNLCFVLGLLLLPTGMRAGDLRPVVRREAGKCAAAWQRSEYERILAYMPPQVILQSGGRAAVLREVKGQFAQAREYGVEQLEAIPGQPVTPKPMGRWLTSLIPLTVVLHRAPLDLIQETHVLGLSADQGKHWYFVVLYQITQKELNARFPEFAGKFAVPEDPAPSLAVFH